MIYISSLLNSFSIFVLTGVSRFELRGSGGTNFFSFCLGTTDCLGFTVGEGITCLLDLGI